MKLETSQKKMFGGIERIIFPPPNFRIEQKQRGTLLFLTHAMNSPSDVRKEEFHRVKMKYFSGVGRDNAE